MASRGVDSVWATWSRKHIGEASVASAAAARGYLAMTMAAHLLRVPTGCTNIALRWQMAPSSCTMTRSWGAQLVGGQGPACHCR